MDPITIAVGLAQYAPSLIKWITGSDKAANIATKAVDIAKQVTGSPSGDEALSVLRGNPDLAAAYAKAVLDQEVAFQTMAAKNAADINATMQVEDKADHWPTYTWRPFIGFCVGLNTITASILVMYTYTAVICGWAGAGVAMTALPATLGALAAISATVLPILGIASWFRGKAQADPNIQTDNRG